MNLQTFFVDVRRQRTWFHALVYRVGKAAMHHLTGHDPVSFE